MTRPSGLALTRADEYSNGLKINPTDSYIGSVARGLRTSSFQFPNSPIPQLPGYKNGGAALRSIGPRGGRRGWT